MFRKDSGDDFFFGRILACRDSLSESIPGFLSALKVPTSDLERSAVFKAAAVWLRNRRPDDNLELRIGLARFAETWTASQDPTPAANDFGKAIVKTFESESPATLQNAIRWLSTDKSLAIIVPQQVLFERAIRWLRQLIAGEPVERTKSFLRELDRNGAFPDWCWCPFLALVRENLNPIDYDWIPDVTSIACTEQKRYAGLWTVLWESGNHDRLLESYAGHVAIHCDDDDNHSLFFSNRAIARSGSLNRISTDLPSEKLKVVLRTIETRLTSLPSTEPQLFSDVLQLCERISETNHPRALIERLAGTALEKRLRYKTGTERIEAARSLDNPGTLSLIDVDQFKPRLLAWFLETAELLPKTKLGEFMRAIPRRVASCADWHWFVLDQFFLTYPDQIDDSLLPDIGHLPTAQAGTQHHYRRLWQYLIDRGDFQILDKMSEVVASYVSENQLPVLVFCPAMCGHADLLPDDLPEEELNELLSQFIEWAKPGADSRAQKRTEALLEFLNRRRESISRSEKSQALVRQFVFKISEQSRADYEACVFDHPVVEDALEIRSAGTQLLSWLAKRVQSKIPAGLVDLRAILPQRLIQHEENAWRFFETVVQNNIDAVAFDALPNVATLPQASPVHYRMLWQHLRDSQHREKLLELTIQVAHRFNDTDAWLAHLQAILESGDALNVRQLASFFERADVRKLSPRILDTLAREAIQHVVAQIAPDSINCIRAIDTTIDQFKQIEFLPLASPTTLAVEFRKIVGNFNLLPVHTHAGIVAESLQSMIPESVPFDPLWKMHRAVILKRRGVRLFRCEIAEACEATPKPESLSLAEIVLACRSLQQLGEFDRLSSLARHGLQIACDVRLYAAYATALEAQGEFAEAAEAATHGWVLSEISGSPDPRFAGILFANTMHSGKKAGKEQGELAAAAHFATPEQCLRHLAERLVPDSFELKMLNAMFRLSAGETADARETIEMILAERSDSDDLWEKRDRVFFDFLRFQCEDNVRIETLSEIAISLLPNDWSINLAQSFVNAGRFSDAMTYVEKVLSAEPNHIDGLLLNARIAIAEFKTNAALELSREVLSIDPNHLRAQSLYIAAMRLAGKSVSEQVQVVRNWAENVPENNRQESLIRRLLEMNFARECFLESWAWFQQNNDSTIANEFVGRSLYAMGECGLAEFFLKRSQPDYATGSDDDTELSALLRKTDQLRSLFGRDSIGEGESINACHELSTSLQSQLEPCEIVLFSDSPQPLTPTRRLLLPAALMHFASEIAPDRRIDSGPVVLVSASLGSGGAERQVVYTARGLCDKLKSRDELVVLCSNLGEQHARAFFLPELKENGIRVETADTYRSELFTETGKENESLIQELLELWPENKGGAIIANYYAAFKLLKPRVVLASQNETNIFAGFAALLVGVPRIVLSGRSLNPGLFYENSAWMKYAYQVLLKNEHIALVNNSQTGAADYCRWLELPDETAVVIHNGFDFAAIDARLSQSSPSKVKREMAIPDDAMVIGTAFRMHKVKRPDYCLNVILELLKLAPNMYGLMVGDGPLWQELVNAAHKSEFADRLRFPGSIQPVEPAMAAMDILLLASEVEGLPNVLVEAQSVGTAVASTDVGGAGETFLAGKSGVIIPGDNAEAAARIIADWIGDKSRIEQAGLAAKEHARANFSLERMIQSTIDILGINELIDRTSDPIRESRQ